MWDAFGVAVFTDPSSRTTKQDRGRLCRIFRLRTVPPVCFVQAKQKMELKDLMLINPALMENALTYSFVFYLLLKSQTDFSFQLDGGMSDKNDQQPAEQS